MGFFTTIISEKLKSGKKMKTAQIKKAAEPKVAAATPATSVLPHKNYTEIPNIIFDYWMSRLKPTSFMLLVCICRKTFGWHKTSDRISKSQLCKVTGLAKNTVQAAIEELVKTGLLIKVQNKNEYGFETNSYRLNIVKPVDNLYTDPDENCGEGRSNCDPGVDQNFTQEIDQNLTQCLGQKLTPQKKDITKERLIKGVRARDPALKFTRPSSDNLYTVTKGEFVALKEGEYEKLCAQFGSEVVDYYIAAINNWVPNNKPYKDYAAAIRQWHLRDQKEGKLPKIQKLSPSSSKANESIEKCKKLCEAAERQLKDLFTSRVYFQSDAISAKFVNFNKDFHKEYIYSNYEPQKLKEQILNDCELFFPNARNILLGAKNKNVLGQIGLSTQNIKKPEVKGVTL